MMSYGNILRLSADLRPVLHLLSPLHHLHAGGLAAMLSNLDNK